MNYKKIATDNICVLFNLYCSLVEQYKRSEISGVQHKAEFLENQIEGLREVCLDKATFLLSSNCSEDKAKLINEKINCYIRLIMIKVQDDYVIDVLNLLSQLKVKLKGF